jgi:hypothetical protein
MAISSEGYVLLIAAIGKIPKDIQFIWMTEECVEQAKSRVIPFEFEGEGPSEMVKCIHPDWFARFDEIVGSK